MKKGTAEFLRTAHPPEFLGHGESLRRLAEVENEIRGALSKDAPGHTHCALRFMLLMLQSERKLIAVLNAGEATCAMPWSTLTGLPSHPTLIADALGYEKRHELAPMQRVAIRSFKEWTPFAEENYLCCCGNILKPKQVHIVFKLNTVCEETLEGLLVKCFIGADTPSKTHRKHHYTFSKESRSSGDIAIVCTFEHVMRFRGGELSVECRRYLRAEEFSFEQFIAMTETIVSV